MYNLYHTLTSAAEPTFHYLLQQRLKKGKEDAARLEERKGVPSLKRPEGSLIWVHAASVGEAQSTLILVNRLLAEYDTLNVLVTTGTVTSATLMKQRLPARAFHQYYPLDHPDWVSRFLDYWRPDMALWMESELWPNMLMQIKADAIPCVLVNARLSERSFKRWKFFKSVIAEFLDCFEVIFCQTEKDEARYIYLGAVATKVTGNLKFSASPLGFDKASLQELTAFTTGRPLWLYASTHKGEEEMACRLHQIIKTSLPDLLTIIVPRHPERREEIMKSCAGFGLNLLLRGEEKRIPQPEDDIYIADTLGELGLFYRLAPIACIGRSFSNDGGGGHNPIEAAQLGCAVLHGPNVQNLQEIFDMMDSEDAALRMGDESHLRDTLTKLLTDGDARQTLQNKALTFARSHIGVADIVMQEISDIILHKTSIENFKHKKNAHAE
jgi:3-deoxy-D-manno-octulosonic-acid transferase